MPSCYRRSTKSPRRLSTPILLSDIPSLPIYITSKIHYSITCGNCKPKLDPHQKTRKKTKKTEWQKSNDRQYERYCLTEYATKANSTEGQVIMHCAVHQHLQIDQDIII